MLYIDRKIYSGNIMNTSDYITIKELWSIFWSSFYQMFLI